MATFIRQIFFQNVIAMCNIQIDKFALYMYTYAVFEKQTRVQFVLGHPVQNIRGQMTVDVSGTLISGHPPLRITKVK